MRVFLIDFENVHNDGLAGIDMLTDDDEVVIFYSANADSISFELLHKFMFSKAKLNYYKVRRGGKNALDFQLSSYLGYRLKIEPDAEFYIISKDNGFDFVIDFWSYGYVDISPYLKRFISIKTMLAWLAGQAAQTASEKAAAVKAVEKLITEKNKQLEVVPENNGAETAEAEKPTEEKAPVNAKVSKPRKIENKTVKAETVETPVEISESDLEQTNELMTKAKSTHELYILTVKKFGQKKGVEVYSASKPQFMAMLKNSKAQGIS